MNGSIKRIIDFYLEESIEGKKRKSLFQEVINGRGTHQIDDTIHKVIKSEIARSGQKEVKFIRLRRRPRALPVDECVPGR